MPNLGSALSIATLGEGGGFNLEAYLATLPAAAYWDFTKTDRHFQSPNGDALASAIGNPIGLALDQAAWARRTYTAQLAQAAENIRNQNGSGAVAGTPGTPPNNWTASAQTGYAFEMVGTGTDSDGAYTEYKLSGTDVGLRAHTITFETATQIVAASGEVWVNNVGLKIVAGGLTGLNALLGMDENTSGSAYVGGGQQAITPTGTMQRFSLVRSLAGGATVARVQPWLRFTAPGGVATSINFRIYAPSMKKVAGNHGAQATGSLQPVRQTTGAKLDGSDDNHLTTYLAGSSNNFLAGLLTIPATIASTQVIAGLQDATPSGLSLSVSTSGLIGGRIGTSSLTGSGTSDQRGNRVPVAITGDGSSWRLFVGSAQENQGSASGMSTSVALRLGSLNNNGSASAFFGGSIERFIAGRDYLDLSRWLQIRSALLAA